jgi:hypothetical protein
MAGPILASMPAATAISLAPVRGPERTVRCSAHPCKEVKNGGNHWFITWSDDPKGMFHCVGYSDELFDLIGEGQARPACGSRCAQRLMEKYLDGKPL